MSFLQQVSGILILIGLTTIVGIAYEWGKTGTFKKALKAIFDWE